MSYTPTEWKKGDKVTSAKLNKLEQGVADAGVLVVNYDVATDALDKTWQEIADAPFATIKNLGSEATAYAFIVAMMPTVSGYIIVALGVEPPNGVTVSYYIAQTADDYPVYFDPNGGDGGEPEPSVY